MPTRRRSSPCWDSAARAAKRPRQESHPTRGTMRLDQASSQRLSDRMSSVGDAELGDDLLHFPDDSDLT